MKVTTGLRNDWRVEPVDHQTTRCEESGDLLSPEAREDARLLAVVAEGE